ncbi:hypothetical protein KJA15_01925 [Patescibacteria group bacterium]|nr:hypothetical protein [Patescibacteria group bacterium]
MSDFLKRIQGLPLIKRKIILWSIVVILGLILGTLWVKSAQKRIRGFQKEEFFEELKLPELEEELEEELKEELEKLPKNEIEEELEKSIEEMEELIKEAEKQSLEEK